MQEYRHRIHRSVICFGMLATVHANHVPQNRLGRLDNHCVYGRLVDHSIVVLDANASYR